MSASSPTGQATTGDRFTERVYRLLLAALPADLAPGADEMASTYADLAAAIRRDAGRVGGSIAGRTPTPRRSSAGPRDTGRVGGTVGGSVAASVAELALLARCAVGLARCVVAARTETWMRSRGVERAAASAPAGRRSRSEQGAGEMWTNDLSYAIRSLRRKRGYAAGVVLLVALGVGTVTAVFSVMDAVLLRALPYPDAERLVFFGQPAHSGPKFHDWSEKLSAVTELAAAWAEPVALTGVGEPVRVNEARVNDGFFDLFAAAAVNGRLLDGGDFTPGSRVVVLGHELWQSHFGGDPAIVGRAVTIEGEPHDVVGVMARRFRPPEALVGDRVDLWVPLDFTGELFQDRHVHVLQVAGKLPPAVALETAQAEADALAAALAEQFPESERQRNGTAREVPLVNLHEATTGEIGRALTLLLTAVSAMLLIACANVAALTLARASGRERELSLRSALGASRGRVASLLLVESLLLALAGGAAGIGIAALALRAFRAWAPSDIPRFGEVAIDWRVVAFALALSLLTGLLFGVAPALRSARADVASALREQGSGPSRRKQRLRSALVVVQVALALALSVGSGLLFHSFLRLRAVELGFEPDRVARVKLQLGRLEREEDGEAWRRQFAETLLDQVAALPGVEASALGWSLPFDFVGGSRCCWRSGFSPTSRPEGGEQEPVAAMINPVTPDYFRVLGVPMLEGRGLEPADDDAELPAIVLNRELAERLFPEGGAVGSTVARGDRSSLSPDGMGPDTTLRVVGVVADFRSWGLDQEAETGAFVSYRRFGARAPLLSLAVRSSLPLDTLSESLRRTIWQIDPNLPIESISELEQRISSSIAVPRFYAGLLLAFAALALSLAAAGIYGSLVYSVGQRVREMGVRVALGAARHDVVRLVVAQGLAQVAAGLALGLVVVLFTARLLESALFGIESHDPWALAISSLVLAAVALLACWLPARRAAATDPVTTLRAE